MKNNFKQIMKKEADKNLIKLNEYQIDQLDEFRNHLISWNKRVNLTRITEPEDFAKRHVIDSLIVAKNIRINPGARVIDVGTGPGIPGLVLKIYRQDIDLTLLESIGKKTDFLKWVIDKMSIADVKVINERAETMGHVPSHREKYDISMARAVSSLNTITELCLPFVKIGGLFIAMKGGCIDEEIMSSQKALETLNGKVKKCIDYELDDIKRNLIVIEKVKSCPGKFPRRPGIPEKRPL